ncbi:hypothetical protein B0T11DRAFT_329451 [Plectosphaerella cucumerina]|uniref:Zn(2)-C6 fungal-type domain-containing protein n=1 Tax=Plectosphaerella cucumerina TaxID=40658 RepID=A0A8K0X650_9PEZI|nr:hypothetical protein B0T11DRAFT_329451 [Plectosphaerella cucumerina]
MKRARVESPATTAAAAAHKSKISRKITACQQCQTRKIKCDLEPGQAACTRCGRLGLECVVNKSLQTLLDDENEWKQGIERQLATLQSGMADMQRMLGLSPGRVGVGVGVGTGAGPSPATTVHVPMPVQSSPAGPSPSRPQDVTAMTRENSPDEAETNDPAHPRAADQAIVDAPMASLFEVTKLRNIRSDPASHRAAAARRPREPDFIDDGRVPLQDAEQLFARFRGTLNAYLWGGIALTHDTLASARESSPLLAAAVLAVTALHAEDGGHAFDACYPIFLELAGQSMFQRYHTLDDVRGLCIGAFWLSDVSWKLSGLAVRIATELNLHRSAARALRDGAQDVDEARLWYLLYVCDHHFSIAYGRPPVIPEDATIARHEAFLQLPGTGQADMRLHSQVAIFVILSRVYHTFGPDRSRLVANDEFESIRRYDADLFAWKRTWEPRLVPDPNIAHYPAKGVRLHYYFARLLLMAVCLRGLSPSEQFLVSPERRGFIDTAIESASAALRLILDDPDMRRAVVGVPLYLLTTIAYAAIFLMKVQSEWRAAGFRIAHDEVVPLLEAVVAVLNESRACARHVAHHLGKGLGAMLVKFKEREAMHQAQLQQAQQPWMDAHAQAGWSDWMLAGADQEYYPTWLDVLGSQMPG